MVEVLRDIRLWAVDLRCLGLRAPLTAAML
jgi:hypothetical protein